MWAGRHETLKKEASVGISKTSQLRLKTTDSWKSEGVATGKALRMSCHFEVSTDTESR